MLAFPPIASSQILPTRPFQRSDATSLALWIPVDALQLPHCTHADPATSHNTGSLSPQNGHGFRAS
jgi:hypothetical protein